MKCRICQMVELRFGERVCPSCKPIQRICCTDVVDGARACKEATMPELERARLYELKHGRRSGILRAIERTLNKITSLIGRPR